MNNLKILELVILLFLLSCATQPKEYPRGRAPYNFQITTSFPQGNISKHILDVLIYVEEPKCIARFLGFVRVSANTNVELNLPVDKPIALSYEAGQIGFLNSSINLMGTDWIRFKIPSQQKFGLQFVQKDGWRDVKLLKIDSLGRIHIQQESPSSTKCTIYNFID